MAARFLLTFEDRQVVLMPGPPLIAGRGTDCAIQFDDLQVSRRHAAFAISGQKAEVRDLGSRNGIVVNGEKSRGTVTIGEGDRVMIATHEILVQSVTRSALQTVPAATALATLPPPESGGVAKADAAGRREPTTQSLSLFDGFLDAGAKALRLGKLDDARTSVDYLIAAIDEAARRKEPVERAVVHGAARNLLGIASVTLDGAYIERLLGVHRQTGVLIDDTTADGILALLPRLRPERAICMRLADAARRRCVNCEPEARP